MKNLSNKILLAFCLTLSAGVFWQCDRAPDQPVPVKSEEDTKIPFEQLSGTIVFRRNLVDFPDNYYFIQLDASAQSISQITNFDVYIPSNLALSPDGTEILFSYFVYKGQTRTFLWQLYSMDLNSLIAHNVSPSLFDDSYGAWSRDGMKIAFWSKRNSFSSLWLADLEHDSSFYLTDVEEVNRTRPSWYPDGEHLLFADSDSSGKPTLLQLSLSSLTRTPLYSDEQSSSNVAFKHPAISPDGKTVAFVKAFLDYTEELWTFGLESRTATRLTEGHSDWHPVWSPDGSKILFSRTRYLFLINKDGSGLTQVTFRDDCTDEFPSWNPNLDKPDLKKK
ncbi:MAG: TolB family protein [Candidatus Zhuqueibacterota bacterium]